MNHKEFWEWLNSFKNVLPIITPNAEESFEIAEEIDKTFGKFLYAGRDFDWKEAKKEIAYLTKFMEYHPKYKYVYDATPSYDSNTLVFSEIELPNASELTHNPDFI